MVKPWLNRAHIGTYQPHNANKDANIASEVDLLMAANNTTMNYVRHHVTVEDVGKCISKMKLHKAAYHISFLTVLLMYGTLSLTVLFYHLQWQVLNINCRHLT